MRGCRPFNEEQVQDLLNSFKNSDKEYADRDRAWFAYGISTGFRITELLSLRIKDVAHNYEAIPYATARRAYTKGKKEGRTQKVEEWAQKIMQFWLDRLKEEEVPEKYFVFQSNIGEDKAITRQWAYYTLIEECSKCKIYGNLGTHSMRKTFANRVRLYFLAKHQQGEMIDPQELTMQATGHKHEESLKAYLSFLHMEKDEDIFDFSV